MASALEETKVQEKQLFIKYGIKAATSAAGIAADLMASFPGPQQAVGAALSVVTWLTDKSVSLKLHMVKQEQIREARSLLNRAKMGDAEAKTLLFQKHAVYAKGMIAAMAQERDPYAMSFVQSRGLDDSEIQASSFQIISKYLMSKAEQDADEFNYDTEDTKWRDRMVAFKKTFNLIANLFGKPAYEMESDNRIDELKTFCTKISEMDELHDNALTLFRRSLRKEEVANSGSTNQTFVKQEQEVQDFTNPPKPLKMKSE